MKGRVRARAEENGNKGEGIRVGEGLRECYNGKKCWEKRKIREISEMSRTENSE